MRSVSFRDRIPNLLTGLRLVLVVPIVALYIHGLVMDSVSTLWLAFSLYVAACTFDYLDGYLARLWSCQSTWGEKWDPRADKALIVTLVVVMCGTHMSLWYLLWPAAAIIFFREYAVDRLRSTYPSLNLKSTFLAKCKTLVQMIAIGVLMLATPLASGSIFEFALWSGTMAFWAAAVLTALTGLDYFAKAYKRLDTYIGPFLVICRIRAV